MADEALGREVVEFTATGLDEMKLSVEEAREAILKQYTATVALNAVAKDPAMRQRAKDTARLAKETRELLSIEEQVTEADKQRTANATRAAAIRSGAYRQETTTLANLRREAEKLDHVERKDRLRSGQFLSDSRAANSGRLAGAATSLGERQRLLTSGEYLRGRNMAGSAAAGHAQMDHRERTAALDSGLYVKEQHQHQRLKSQSMAASLRERRVLVASGLHTQGASLAAAHAQEAATVGRLERHSQLVGEHGRLAGSAMYGLERARPGMLAAGAAGAVGLGMARRGLSGTVEGGALEREMGLLNREIGNSLVPVLRDLTGVVRWLRDKAEKLTGGQQDALGYGIAGVAAIGGLGLAANTIKSALSGLSTVAVKLGLKSASAAGPLLASAAGGGLLSRTVSPAVSGSLPGAPPIGTGKASAIIPIGLPAGALPAAGAASKGSRLARFGRAAGPIGAALAIGGGLANMEPHEKSFYRLARESGENKLASTVGGLFASLAEFVGAGDVSQFFGGRGTKGFREDMARKKVRDLPNEHHNSLIKTAGFEDLDAAYERTATEVAMASAFESEPGGKLHQAPAVKDAQAESASTLRQILEILFPLARLIPPAALR